MAEMVNVKLSVEQIRLLREVTIQAASDVAEQARQTKSVNAKDQLQARFERLQHLTEIFEKTAP